MKPTADPTGWDYADAPPVAGGGSPVTVAEYSDEDRCWYVTTRYHTPDAPGAVYQYRVRLPASDQAAPVGALTYG
tara:strand:+ start:860 stop:1084 length:225 start_codon:yes stop_codon:yes gene_type:complete